MVCVGIDVAKDKHDCCILDSDGTIRADCITIPNNMDGFKQLLQTIRDCTKKSDKIKVGLEATGHYSYNILGFLLDNDLAVYVMIYFTSAWTRRNKRSFASSSLMDRGTLVAPA